MRKVIALAGGVGAAKLLRGLIQAVNPKDLVIVGNTGDDTEFHGLHVSPDLDIVMYTLAGIVDEKKGWGISKDTYDCLKMMEKLGLETWFKLGDRDLAFQIARSNMLKKGLTLTEVTDSFCQKLGITARLVPMSDYPVRTKIISNQTVFNFQEYFVKLKCEPTVRGFRFIGSKDAAPAPVVLSAIQSSNAVVICPSNPWVSIDPILSLPGVRSLMNSKVVVAVSPIIAGRTVKGPAAKMYLELGITPSALAVANHYHPLLTGFILDAKDESLVSDMPIPTLTTDTLMNSLTKRIALAKDVLHFIGRLLNP